MPITISETISKPLIYRGGNQTFTDLDAPGIILTQLRQSDFSHIETRGDKVDVVIRAEGTLSRLKFTKNIFDKFMIILKDESALRANLLDEHILLEDIDQTS